MNLFNRLKHNHDLSTIVFGIIFITFVLFPFLSSTYVIKEDYVFQHLPFYNEFFHLIDQGLPFWSWNCFLGLNFWGSKAYYLIGDPYAWLSVILRYVISDLPKLLTIILLIKFYVSFLGFYYLTKYWKIPNYFRFFLGLAFVFSGWNLIFIEQPMYTSFYSLIPLLLLSYEIYYQQNSGWFLSISVAVLVSINFYLFWVASWLFLVYYVIRYLQTNFFNLKKFVAYSFKILLHFVLGVLLSAIVWLPGLLHLMQSGRGNSFLIDYTNWNFLQFSSLFTFSIIPSLKYLDGILKDDWYYFNQIGLYISVLSLLIIPQTWFIQDRKNKLISICVSIFLLLLLVSPKIGLFFHFTYSLRYTLINTLISLFLVSISLRYISEWKIKIIILSEFMFSIVYLLLIFYIIPLIHPTLPTHTEELSLLHISYALSLVYSILIILYLMNKTNTYHHFFIIGLVFVTLIEFTLFAQAEFKSQENTDENYVYYTDIHFQNALEYIQSIDDGFYRIYSNNQNTFSNLPLAYQYKSITTYDTTFEYTQSEFLNWTRQYPYVDWNFNLNDSSTRQFLGVKYAIVKDAQTGNQNDLYLAGQIGYEKDFGPYTIFEYYYDVAFARTYNSIKDISGLHSVNIEDGSYRVYEFMDKVNTTLYIDVKDIELANFLKPFNTTIQYFDPSSFTSNKVLLDITLSSSSAILLNMPYDKGWQITDNGRNIEGISAQGGFMALLLDKGDHAIKLTYTPPGLIIGTILSFFSILLILLTLNLKKSKSSKSRYSV